MKELIASSIQKAISYEEYRQLVSHKVEQQQTTGPNQTEALAEYTRLNDYRMRRLDKTIRLNDRSIHALNLIKEPVTWLVLTEGWCGDAAQSLPIINAMASFNSSIDLKVILRDENLELMDHFLTGNGRSIPKLIFIDSESNELFGHWGPRPSEAQRLYLDLRNQNLTYSEINIEMQGWYNKNKAEAIQLEISEIIRITHSKKTLV